MAWFFTGALIACWGKYNARQLRMLENYAKLGVKN